MSFKDNDETPAQRKARELNEDASKHAAITVTYCKPCGCHYTGGCKEHSLGDQVSLGTKK